MKDRAWRGYFAASGHGLQTTAGRLIQPIVVNDADGQSHSADIYSDNHGATWYAGNLLTAGSNESKAVELADGTILQNIRPMTAGYRLTATSTDGGITFTPTTPAIDLPDPSVNADEIRVNPSTHGPHRDWLLFANDADQLAHDHLTLRLSCDNGASWPIQKVIYPGPASYVAMVMLPHDRVGMIYDGGVVSRTEQERFTSISLSHLGGTCRR